MWNSSLPPSAQWTPGQPLMQGYDGQMQQGYNGQMQGYDGQMQGQMQGGGYQTEAPGWEAPEKPRSQLSNPLMRYALGGILLPCLLFPLVMLPFALFYAVATAFSWILFVAAATVSILLIWRGRSRTAEEPLASVLRVSGCVSLVYTVMACLLGRLCYHSYTEDYYLYLSSRFYTNVIPTEDPIAKRDGTMFTFAAGSFVDTTMSVGYTVGSLYCAAPVVGVDVPQEVGYWAVGVDCCRGRGYFRCGDVPGDSYGGVKVLPDDPNVPMYALAAQQSAAAFGLRLPKSLTFVNWSTDPVQVRDALWDNAVQFYVTASLTVSLTSLAVAAVAAFLVSRRLKTKAMTA